MAEKRVEAAKENNERWLLSYADFITLLLVFFIILYSFSEVDQTKFTKLAQSLQQAFNAGVLQGQVSTGVIVGSGGQVGQIQISNIQYIQDQVGKDLQSNNLADEVSLGNRKEGLVITISGEVLFPSGGAALTPKGKEILATLADRLRAINNDVRIEGYTDDIPIQSQQFPSNWELSTARGLAVLHYFVDEQKLAPDRFSAAGYGEFHPLVPNDSAEDRAKNRRVEIVVLQSGGDPGQPSLSANGPFGEFFPTPGPSD